jgi:outer membrane protein OmpA-like peptidoglycan-associated protein
MKQFFKLNDGGFAMRDARHGVDSRLGMGLILAALLFLLSAVLPAPCRAAEINLSSQTYLLYFERDVAGGDDLQFAPLYEYLSGSARELGGMPLSFHFYGWGRIDLADDTDDDGTGGDLASAYLQYLHPTGNAEMRLGRFFLTEGTAAEIMDGVFLKGRTPLGFGLSVFGGVPVERTITSTDTGDSIYGGRLFFSRAGFAEIGATYLVENGDFQGDDREMIGGDLWVSPGIPVELTGRAFYNVSTSSMAQQRYVLRLVPISRLDLALGYEEYKYKDLFQTALHSAFLSPAIDNTDEVQVLFAIVDFQIAEGLTVEAVGKSIEHDVSDPGDATRGELGVRYVYNDRKDVGGLSVAIVSADRDENEYQEYRAFATYSPGRWRFSLDALTHRYKEEISGIDDAYHVVGSAGVQVLPYLKVSGDVTYTRSPRFSKDYVGLLRISIDLSASTEDGLSGRSGEEETEAAAAAETPPVETAPSPETAPATPETELPAVASAPETVPAKPETGLPGADAAAGDVAAPPAGLPAGEEITGGTAKALPPVPVAPPTPRAGRQAKAVSGPAAYLDLMASEIRATFQDAIVGREGEIVEFTLPSDLVFGVGSAVVTPAARESLAMAAEILTRYPETLVTIEGHTDSMGMVESNQELSEKRARSVFDILVQNGVAPLRLSMRGYGERFPVADNSTAEGRQANRRVQMKIRPDRNLKSRQGQGG